MELEKDNQMDVKEQKSEEEQTLEELQLKGNIVKTETKNSVELSVDTTVDSNNNIDASKNPVGENLNHAAIKNNEECFDRVEVNTSETIEPIVIHPSEAPHRDGPDVPSNSEYQASVASVNLPPITANPENSVQEQKSRPVTKVSSPSRPTFITNYKQYPTRMIRLATVSLTSGPSSGPRPRTVRSTFVDTPRQSNKVIGWDEANNARPPLRIDMEGPTACTYTPTTKPPRETNSPAWSFGRRTFVERGGGTRTSWEKTWFQTPHIWNQKCDFFSDNRWPCPVKYDIKPTIGPNQSTKLESPSFSLGVKRDMKTDKKASMEPAPNEYNNDTSFSSTARTAPAYSHGFRRHGTRLWSSTGDVVPGPGTHNPKYGMTKRHNPSFSIQGIRREKTHVYGPFATF